MSQNPCEQQDRWFSLVSALATMRGSPGEEEYEKRGKIKIPHPLLFDLPTFMHPSIADGYSRNISSWSLGAFATEEWANERPSRVSTTRDVICPMKNKEWKSFQIFINGRDIWVRLHLHGLEWIRGCGIVATNRILSSVGIIKTAVMNNFASVKNWNILHQCIAWMIFVAMRKSVGEEGRWSELVECSAWMMTVVPFREKQLRPDMSTWCMSVSQTGDEGDDNNNSNNNNRNNNNKDKQKTTMMTFSRNSQRRGLYFQCGN